MSELLPLAVAIFYALALFAFAHWAENTTRSRLKQRIRLPAYALALAVYCTSWTYYGAVGTAVADGWSYLPIYLGPILVFGLGHRFLKRLVEAVKVDGANSISEFIGGRFSNSQGVAALVTVLALGGSIPYLALQLRSLGTTYALITSTDTKPMAIAAAAFGLALFAMLYGTRRYEAASRNDAVLFAVGVESLLKILSLTVAVVLAVSLLIGAPEQIAEDGMARLSANFAPSQMGIDFLVITFLSMAAIVCLPRQFYVTVIEARSSNDVTRARWPFLLYLLITLLVVPPISAAGLALLPADARPDLFVLQLPLAHGQYAAAILIFLGGFSAATAMVLVETIALSTMISNDLISPFLLRMQRFRGEGDLGRALLIVRRASIALVMMAALIWALGINANERLASIGLIAFAAMAQFAPVLLLAVMGPNQDALAAKAGLGAGLLLWAYTLAIPEFASTAMLDALHGTPFDPNALLGVDGLSPISHGTIWSLGANLIAFMVISIRRVHPGDLAFRVPGKKMAGSVSTVGELKSLVTRFVGPELVSEVFADVNEDKVIDSPVRRKAERMIASVVGVPSARTVISSALHGSNLTHEEVARILDDTGQSLRFSKGLLAATLENIDQGVSVVDSDLNLIAWNRRYLELFDYPEGMVRVGAPIADLIRYNAERGECGPGEVDAHVERRLSHMRRRTTHSFKRKRPGGRIIKTVGGPMPSGGYVMSFTDVTAEEEALAALENARSELEARVDSRTRELREANQALASADAEKTRFLAAASHDLLQPLHAARLFSAALARELPDAQKGKLMPVENSIDAAETLLRALLDISKLDAGGVIADKRPIGLHGLLIELAQTLAPMAREKGLKLNVAPGDAVVESDPGLLRSMVQNLLSNAIRHTRSGGVVVGVRRRGGMARIDVVDSGPGIPAEKNDLIFREFERLPTAGEGGVGLGLAIVQRTARLLGAQISLRSIEGRGSRFSISLPIAASRPIPQSVEASVLPAADSFLVLVVDDDPANCEALKSWLEGAGHDVLIAIRPADALAVESDFDLAFVDFNLGAEMDGLTLIDALRRGHARARYALITAAREQDYASRAAAMGVTVLRKPAVLADIERWLGTAEDQKAAE